MINGLTRRRGGRDKHWLEADQYVAFVTALTAPRLYRFTEWYIVRNGYASCGAEGFEKERTIRGVEV